MFKIFAVILALVSGTVSDEISSKDTWPTKAECEEAAPAKIERLKNQVEQTIGEKVEVAWVCKQEDKPA